MVYDIQSFLAQYEYNCTVPRPRYICAPHIDLRHTHACKANCATVKSAIQMHLAILHKMYLPEFLVASQ